jgi:hypothetical protein
MFRVEEDQNNRTYRLQGTIDESADLAFLRALHGGVKVNLRQVARISSFGVRSWIEALNHIPADARIEFHEVPPHVVNQINMVSGFLGRGRVCTFFAPMVCEACGHEAEILFAVGECQRNECQLPPTTCPQCRKRMVIDELEAQYLLFVRLTS